MGELNRRPGAIAAHSSVSRGTPPDLDNFATLVSWCRFGGRLLWWAG